MVNPTLKYGLLAFTSLICLNNYLHITSLEVKRNLHLAVVSSIVGYFLVFMLIPRLQQYLYNHGLRGKDLGRRGQSNQDEEIPSALGVIVGVIFLITIIILQVFDATTMVELAQYNAALHSICFMLFLGFADDVLDLPWRFKLLLPPIASLPLLCSYLGETSIMVPVALRSLFYNSTTGALTTFSSLIHHLWIVVDEKSAGSILNLGPFYYLYMSLLSVFCTNSINIYAGINGLEVGQSIIVAVAILITNLYQLQYAEDTSHPHMISAMILICFIGVSLALLWYNWYPASVFVGDTYCYFAGMTFAVVGILGNFTKTLLIYLLPQIINFLYSCPQLFRFYPCPRHRLPGVDKNGLRVPSTFVTYNGKTKDNMTLINLILYYTGPIREETLTFILLLLQAAVCGIGFGMRNYLAIILFDTY